MLVEREREKLLHALIYFSQNVRHPGKTKLFKLLNWLDFMHFEKTGRSVTGLEYEAWDMGPVPKALFQEWDRPQSDFVKYLMKKKETFPGGKERQVLIPRVKFDETLFTPFQLRLMKTLAKTHFNKNAEEMSEESHFETGPWSEVYNNSQRESDKIPYDLVLLRRGNEKDLEILEIAKERQAVLDNYAKRQQ